MRKIQKYHETKFCLAFKYKSLLNQNESEVARGLVHAYFQSHERDSVSLSVDRSVGLSYLTICIFELFEVHKSKLAISIFDPHSLSFSRASL